MNDQQNENNEADILRAENNNRAINEDFSDDDEYYEEMYEDVLDSRATFTEYVTFLKKTFSVLYSADSQRFLQLRFIEKFPLKNYLKEMESTCTNISEIEDDLASLEEYVED